jgi:hypothetical protein
MSLKNPVTPSGIDPGTVRLVAQPLNHYATPGPALMTWERKILRKKYGPAYENSYWRIKMNKEIYNQFQYPGTVTVIKVRRLERLYGL